MKSAILALTISTLLMLESKAQNLSIKGIVTDTISLIKLKNTSVSILNAKDSTLVRFTRAGGDGSFTMSNLRQGKFILLATYPGYADYVEHFKLDSSKAIHDFGKISMILKSNLLKDIVIKGTTAAIKIKGDTTEYNAASFKVEPNAKVEDLLKQLPGIQVDKDGKITAQGQTVNKVLVDGEEFFGDDPTLVTKNLRADMIDKVQLYDKKSDQAAFTGIDDGIKNKTIDLKLKEDKKNGLFGKLDGGGLNDGFYQGQGMFNMFKGKKKFSAYGTVGNTGKTGLNWRDSEKYGAGGVNVSDDGGLYIDRGGDELDAANFGGSGIPEIRTGGVHYDAKWNKNKESINTNYKSGYLTVDGNENSGTFNNLPGQGRYINTNSTQNFSNSTFRQKLDATYQLSPDSTTNIKFTIDGSLKNTSNFSFNTSLGARADSSRINDSWRRVSNEGESQSFNASAFYSKKLKKKGRTFSLNFTQSFNNGSSSGTLNSSNQFYDTLDVAMKDSILLVDQLKRNKNFSSRTNTNATYTEPLSKKWSLVLNYGFGVNNSNTDKRSYNKASENNYSILDSIYSNNFDVNQISNQGGAVFRYKQKKTNISLGSRATAVNFNQKDLFSNRRYDRDFINWNPQASYQYKFSNYKSFRMDYNGRTNQPGVDQLQPVRANTDPLNISLGNPDLKASFTNSFNVNFNSFKVLSNRSIYAYGSYSYTVNPIVNSTITNDKNASTYQSVNLKDKFSNNYYLYANYNRKITKLELNIGFNLNTDANVYYSYINNDLTKSKSNNYSGGVSLSQYKQKKYDVYVSFNPGYNTNETSIPQSKNNNGWVYYSNAGFNVYLPGKFQISSNANHEYREKTASFNEDFKRLIWNASVSKKFMKQDNVILTLSGNDLLNENNGFSRRINNNIVTQRSYVTIKRYFLASLVWEFNKMGGGIKTPTSAAKEAN